jgi:hypothetical protein
MYVPLIIATAALPAHIAHGNLQPDDAVRGRTGHLDAQRVQTPGSPEDDLTFLFPTGGSPAASQRLGMPLESHDGGDIRVIVTRNGSPVVGLEVAVRASGPGQLAGGVIVAVTDSHGVAWFIRDDPGLRLEAVGAYTLQVGIRAESGRRRRSPDLFYTYLVSTSFSVLAGW